MEQPGRGFSASPVAGAAAGGAETLTFLFTDIESSTALLRRVGEGVYAQVLADHQAIIRSGLADHGGREVDTAGDGFFAVFSSPGACAAAVLEMQRALEVHAWPAGERVRVRMGVHTGEASRAATGPVGLDVHRAARVAAVGYGGQVLVSETASALVRDRLPPGASLADLGVHRLKDLGRPERIFQLQAAGLQAGFPPLRSLGNPVVPNNLPHQLATFIGRDQELAEVRSLVGSSRLVTLTGAGGCGKTRLGLQVAAGLLDGSGDGVWLVELAAVTGESAVAPTVCGALGIAGQPGRPALETLLDALAPQDMLIVLDNCEHLTGACAKIADAIVARCPLVRLLATSREPLGIGGETIFRVPPLSLPGPGDIHPGSSDAVALFVERAKQQGVDLSVDEQTAPLVVSICRRLDGMPLAIELAAGRLRSLSLTDLNDRLDQRFRLLTGGSRTALPRQRTLRATVEWSYSLLNGTEQVLLARLSVFAEGFGLDAAEGVCGFGDVEVFDVADLLGSLVDKSLVVAEPTGETGGALRYRLLETIRQFAAERLAETGPGAAAAEQLASSTEAGETRPRHAGHYAGLAAQFEAFIGLPEEQTSLLRIGRHHADLRAALDYCLGAGQEAWALWLAAALGWYHYAHGDLDHGQALVSAVLPSAADGYDPAAMSDDATAAGQTGLLIVAGVLAWATGQTGRAQGLLRGALERSERRGDARRAAMACAFLGHVARGGGEWDASADWHRRAEARFREEGSIRGVAWARHDLGLLARDHGDLGSAAELLRASLRDFRELDYQWAVASSAWGLGATLTALGRVEEAGPLLAEALRIYTEVNDPRGVAQCLEALAFVASERAHYESAARLIGAAAALRLRVTARQPDTEQARSSAVEQALARALGSEDAETLIYAGRTMPAEQAVDLAMAVASGAAPGDPDRPQQVPLTPRERQVAALVASGWTNRQIGRVLGISEKTAEVHLHHVMSKLDARSRAEVAAWAVTHHLSDPAR